MTSRHPRSRTARALPMRRSGRPDPTATVHVCRAERGPIATWPLLADLMVSPAKDEERVLPDDLSPAITCPADRPLTWGVGDPGGVAALAAPRDHPAAGRTSR